MNFVFKNSDKELFIKLWKEYVNTHNASYEYTLEVLEYYLAYSSNLYDDQSFVVQQNNMCVGICFLPIEKADNILSISISNGYVIAPLSITKKIDKEIFGKVDTICKTLNIDQIKFSLSPFICHEYNTLLSHGFIDTSTNTCDMDLKMSEEQLWMNLRKRYKSLINSLIKNQEYRIVYSNETNSLTLHNTYVAFHKEHMIKAGKKAKDDTIYNKQYHLLHHGLASIIAVEYSDRIIYCDYFFCDDTNVTYASSAYDLDEIFQTLPLNHYLIWESILHYKKLNYYTFNFGMPCGFNRINGFEDYLDNKQIDISSFKRGMGAQTKTQYRGIKFFNNKLILDKLSIFNKEINNE